MAVSRVQTSSIVQGFPKSRSLLAGNSAYIPPAFESIATGTGTGSNTSITFSSIPSTYKHLQIRFRIFSSQAGNDPMLTFNGDTGANYDWNYLRGLGGAGSATSQGVGTDNMIRLMYGASSDTNYPMIGIIDIPDYANTSKNKTTRTFAGQDANGSFGGPVMLTNGGWRSTAAITSLSVNFIGGPTYFNTNSMVALYGIKG